MHILFSGWLPANDTTHIDVPDIAGVRIPSPMTIEVPVRTKSKSTVFKDDLFSKVSFMFKALSSSGVGNLSLKLEIFLGAVRIKV